MISDAVVRQIRIRRQQGESTAALAAEFGLSPSRISSLVTGWARPEAGGPITTPVRHSDEMIEEIRSRVASGERRADLAREYGVTRGWVSSVVSGESRQGAPGPLSEKLPLGRPRIGTQVRTTIRDDDLAVIDAGIESGRWSSRPEAVRALVAAALAGPTTRTRPAGKPRPQWGKF